MIRFWRRWKPLGMHGEDLAARALKRAGYRILERNLNLGRYEIDILAQEGDTVAFVEVKTRRAVNVFEPKDNVTQEKRHHLIQAARIYLSHQEDPSLYYRFDIVSVLAPDKGKPTITIQRDAFQMK